MDPKLPTLADRKRQEELISTHIDLAKALARRFSHRGQPIEDLHRVAVLAVVKAARRYDPEHGAAFASYATVSIVGELKRHFRDLTWSMRVPRSLQELHLAVNQACDELSQQIGASPTVAQVASHLGVTEEQVLEAIEAGSTYRTDTLDMRGPDDSRDHDVAVVDFSFDRVLDKERFRAVLPRLDKREQAILKGLYLDDRTQQDLGGDLGLS